MKLELSNIPQVTEYIFIEDIDTRGDIALVFGTTHAWEGLTEYAVDLYKQKLVPKLLFSGGEIINTGITEAEAMAEKAQMLGVPTQDILIETASKSTLENVLFSRKIIANVFGFLNIRTITAVMRNFHARRVLMTLKRHIPPCIKFKVAAYISPLFDFTKQDWHRTELGRHKVAEELEKIEMYLAKGDIIEL